MQPTISNYFKQEQASGPHPGHRKRARRPGSLRTHSSGACVCILFVPHCPFLRSQARGQGPSTPQRNAGPVGEPVRRAEPTFVHPERQPAPRACSSLSPVRSPVMYIRGTCVHVSRHSLTSQGRMKFLLKVQVADTYTLHDISHKKRCARHMVLTPTTVAAIVQ